MAQPLVTRHFVMLHDKRQVHYRRAGSGPPVILLHQSPASSAELVPLIEELAATYTVIAPDTPGNGLSTQLPQAQATIEDFANSLVSFMDSTGISRAAVYGFHTGAAIAMEMAHRHADRVTVAIANGYTQMQPDELADILQNYLPPLTMQWNGAHLLWAWSRIRDQFIFFPWYSRQPQARLRSGMPGTLALHAGVMDLLRAGNGYAQAYRAAFAYDRAAVVSQIRAPTVIMTARTDALYRYLDKMPQPASCVKVLRPADHVESRQILRETLRAQVGHEAFVPPPAKMPSDGLWRDTLQTAAGSLFALRSVGGSGRPLVFCHDSAGSALGLARHMTPWKAKRPLLAVDLPGNGESQRVAGAANSVAQHARWLAEALESAKYSAVDLLAFGGGACVAAELALLRPDLVHGLSLTEQPGRYFSRQIEPDEYGSHLLQAWNMVRDQQLYEPWHTRKRANVIACTAEALIPKVLHERTLDLLKCMDSLPAIEASHSEYPLSASLAALGDKVVGAIEPIS